MRWTHEYVEIGSYMPTLVCEKLDHTLQKKKKIELNIIQPFVPATCSIPYSHGPGRQHLALGESVLFSHWSILSDSVFSCIFICNKTDICRYSYPTDLYTHNKLCIIYIYIYMYIWVSCSATEACKYPGGCWQASSCAPWVGSTDWCFQSSVECHIVKQSVMSIIPRVSSNIITEKFPSAFLDLWNALCITYVCMIRQLNIHMSSLRLVAILWPVLELHS